MMNLTPINYRADRVNDAASDLALARKERDTIRNLLYGETPTKRQEVSLLQAEAWVTQARKELLDRLNGLHDEVASVIEFIHPNI